MPPPPMDEPGKDGFLRLSDDLVEEVFFRLPPDEPACLVRASAVRKNWRQILADAGFRRRYREYHGAPPFLGVFQENGSFVTTSGLIPFQPKCPRLVAVDCRHGRVLCLHGGFLCRDPPTRYYGDAGEEHPFGIIVLDPLTGTEYGVPSPPDVRLCFSFTAAVLCAAQVCDHHDCQTGHFRVVFLTNNRMATFGWLYSSETEMWSDLTPVHHPIICRRIPDMHDPSVRVDDALYFNFYGVIKCELSTLRLSVFERPTHIQGCLMTAEDGGLGFVAKMGATNLALWSMMTGPQGAMGWEKLRVIDLNTLLPAGALSTPNSVISGIAEGMQVVFLSTNTFCYMLDLKSRRIRKVSTPGRKFFPYIGFYIPAMEEGLFDQAGGGSSKVFSIGILAGIVFSSVVLYRRIAS